MNGKVYKTGGYTERVLRDCLRDRRTCRAIRATRRAPPSRPMVPGSGTVSPETEKAALKVVPPTMSAPTRSQSGARFSLRIQLCRSGLMGGGGVLGAESHKKLPLLSATCGIKK